MTFGSRKRIAGLALCVVLGSSTIAPAATAQSSVQPEAFAEAVEYREQQEKEAIAKYGEVERSSSYLSSGSSTGSNADEGGFSFMTWLKKLWWDLMEFLFNNTGSSDRTFAGASGSAEAVGSSNLPIDTVYKDYDEWYPFPMDDTITEARIISRTVEDPTVYTDVPIQLERWEISSPSMKRNISVQIKLPKDPESPAPILMLLDGMTGQPTSGWLRRGEMPETTQNDNVIAVMPTYAGGSMYTDWESYDDSIGLHKWETFINEELMPLLTDETQSGLKWNGKSAIGGLSMGAGGAVRNAALYPDVWDGTFGVSGCYSTMDPTGKMMARLIVEQRGGDIENMWGTYGSEEWLRHDLSLNPEGLRNMAVYLHASDGIISDIDRAESEESLPVHHVPVWASIEQGMRDCTERLDNAMKEAGMTHQVVHYTTGRIHDWPMYRDEFRPAWDYMRTVLY